MIAAGILVPAALAVWFLSLPDWLVFSVSAAALVPVAGLMGQATEHLAHHLGARAGGLLNATFGNASELIITSFAIQRGLLTLAKASITGSIIGNTLLVLGMSLVAGGLRHGRQHYEGRDASLTAAMMILAVAGLYLPATFAHSLPVPGIIEELSLLMAGVLLLTYFAYLTYTVFLSQPRLAGSGKCQHAGTEQPASSEDSDEGWGVWKALGVLAAATVGAAIASELLVGTVEPVSREYGLTEFFIGVIIVPIIGNAAEHFTALKMAWNNRLDVTLAIAAGSSTQIALFVGPALVFFSLVLGHPLNLIFTPLELVILGLTTAIFAYICLDGESNWLEGVQLLAIYLMAGMAFFLLAKTPS
ncbi:MAG: calcium/proton exchanger [Chloroflexi bacterium]|nr:calcium/proton exchanger [Chloroflexota bacterium]